MSKLERISIQGIRSYNPAIANHISFDGPLTIILGPNGSGKTTVIESLKYITTGDVPTGSKLNSFIHDPKVNGQSEVKGVVKLEFNDLSNNSCVCVRSLISTQKGKKVESRSLEGSLAYTDKDGKVSSMSSRCIDLSIEMISRLGVSKALLDNVIFCHQEISTWPLSEPKILKEKFDAIFSATKYIKALESIKDTRKRQFINVKDMRHELVHLENKKDKLEELRSTLTDNKIKYGLANVEMGSLEKQWQDYKIKLNKLETLMLKITKKTSKLSQFHGEIAMKKIMIEKLEEKTSTIFDLPLEQLNQDLALVVETHENQNYQLSKCIEKENRLKSKIRTLDQLICELRVDLVNQQATYQNIVDDIVALKILLIDASTTHKHNIDFGIDIDIEITTGELCVENVGKISDVIARLKLCFDDCLSVQRVELDAKKNKLSTHENKYGDMNLNAHKRKNDLKQHIDLRKSLEKQLQQKQAHLSAIDGNKNNLDVKSKIIQNLDDKKSAITEIQTEYEELTFVDTALKSEFIEADENYITSKSRYNESLKNVSISLLYEECGKELNQLTMELEQICEKSEYEDIEKLEMNLTTERVLKDFIFMTKSKLDDSSLEYNRLNNELCIVGYRKDETQFELDALNDKIDHLKRNEEKFIEKVISIHGSYTDNIGHHILDDYQTELQHKKEELSKLIATKDIYKVYVDSLTIEEMDDKSCCPLCERKFQQDNEMNDLIAKLGEKQNKFIGSEIELNEDINELENKIAQLHEISKNHDENITDLEDQKINIENQLEEFEDKKKNIERELQDRLEIKLELEVKLTQLSKVTEKNLKRLELLSKFEDFKEQLKKSAQLETPSTLKSKVEQAEVEKNNIQYKLNENRELLLLKQKLIVETNQKISRLKNELSETERNLNIVEELKTNISELTLKGNDCGSTINIINDEIELMEANLNKQHTKVNSLRSVVNELSKNCSNQGALYQNTISTINNQFTRISKFDYEGYKENIENKNVLLTRTARKIQKKNSKIERKQTQISDIQENITQHNTKIRLYQDNIEMKKLSMDIDLLSHQIDCLKNKINAIGDINDSIVEKSKIEQIIEQLKEKIYHSKGVMEGLQSQIAHLEKEINSTFYTDVDMLYHKKSSLLKITELAGDDLEKYYKALDNAIMKFHSLKMTEINKLIKEYWMRTYQGNDINTIEIRSEQETSSNSINARRAYNYKVVMIKNGISLDMRGRCSSGQKMLASIIIRLALAETFCSNCGMLTLDEPTTNLDQKHIHELSKSLVELTESRRLYSSSFQLLVITHDEEFVNTLCRANLTNFFYQISKDENGYSKINRLCVDELFD